MTNNGLKPLRGEANAARRVGMYVERVDSYDYGVGAPFPSGFSDRLVIGDPQDPNGFGVRIGPAGRGSSETGYNLVVRSSAEIWDSMSVFSDYQPYIVIGRTNIDNRYPSIRPRGQGEDVAYGVVKAANSDYFNNTQPGDAVIRAYGPGQGTNGRWRVIHLGSNDGSTATFSDSSLVVTAEMLEIRRPLNLIGTGQAAGSSSLPATPAGYAYIQVAGTRVKVPFYTEPIQVSDTFTSGFQRADTGQLWFTALGSWTGQSGKAKVNSNGGSHAVALIGQYLNSTISADITPGVASGWLVHRCTDGSAGTLLYAKIDTGTGNAEIGKKMSGTFTALASASMAGAWPGGTTHRLGFQASGSNLTLTVDGVTVVTHTLAGGDATTFGSSPNAGILSFDTTTLFDNLTISTP